ncbi:uncharacterized protein LOC135833938 isoform X2 [Planococcus citri]|uniref:uncharacterized protein LOC135833938 isoform X2 n=1 Tax=Planococcus citri TaxID=170843 RepID=UPI0031F7C713
MRPSMMMKHYSLQPIKIKYGHRYRKKKIIHANSEETVLEFDENEDTKTELPDLVQDTDSKNESNSLNSESTPDECNPTSTNCSPDVRVKVEHKKLSLPNNTVITTSKQSLSANNSPDMKATTKKFSLPCDISKDHLIINDSIILDVDNLRKKYNSSTSLPTDTSKLDSLSVDSLRRKHGSIDGFEARRRLDSKVEEFVQEVMISISEIGHGNRGDGVRKLRGIIKKTLSYEKDEPGVNAIRIRKRERCKNTVHFSEENITIEIPRPSKPYIRKVKDKMSYYCCFGFLFPNT